MTKTVRDKAANGVRREAAVCACRHVVASPIDLSWLATYRLSQVKSSCTHNLQKRAICTNASCSAKAFASIKECSASGGADTSAASFLTWSTFCSIVALRGVSPAGVQRLCLQHRLNQALDAALEQKTAHTRMLAKPCVSKFNIRTCNWGPRLSKLDQERC